MSSKDMPVRQQLPHLRYSKESCVQYPFLSHTGWQPAIQCKEDDKITWNQQAMAEEKGQLYLANYWFDQEDI